MMVVQSLLACHYTLIITLLGTMLIGLIAGALGTFALLRKQSLLGDTISHAALPGIAIALLITHSNNPYILLFGGACAGIIGTLLLSLIKQTSSLQTDAILGIILSVFFGIGLVLITHIQKYQIPNQSIINKFLFGSASLLLPCDIATMVVVGTLVMLLTYLFFKEIKLTMFDPSFAHTIGYRIKILDMFITLLLVAIIVVGLQTVGVILMSSMLIAPAAAARQWTQSLKKMMLIAAFFGGTASMLGTCISYSCQKISTGPIIVIMLSIIVALSFVCTSSTAQR